MPRRNTRNDDRPGSVYHAYNREKSRAAMFRDDEDRRFFKSLFERYLSEQPQRDDRGRPYVNYRNRVELWSLTIKTTHYHVVLRQHEAGGAGALIRAVLAVYVRYFNKKYGSGGEMFSGEVRLRPAESRRDVLNLIAYVHENHGDNCYCEFCTHSLYLGHPAHVPDWVAVAPALAAFGGVGGYVDWLAARRAQRRVLGEPQPR